MFARRLMPAPGEGEGVLSRSLGVPGADGGRGEGVGLLYVRVVIIWISVRSAGYYIHPALLSVGGGPGPPVGGPRARE